MAVPPENSASNPAAAAAGGVAAASVAETRQVVASLGRTGGDRLDEASDANPNASASASAPGDEAERLRRRYSDEALLYIPKLLALVDRNPYSSTYGSFDRAYWHYRTMDFPCGMAQEFGLPLALVYRHPFPGNPFFEKERVRELALAGVEYAARSAHPDASCDDYFPFEQALGAAVFSLYAITETCLVLDDRAPERLDFFARRGDWLMGYQETGRLTNHQAFAALALYNVHLLTGEERFRRGADERVALCRAWFHPDEGWFQEYEGADPGYQSCTVDFLAKLWQKSKDESLLELLGPAVRFCRHFLHPDGSYAGEYGSRNTYHFYPHGFEVLAPRFEEARQIADRFLHRALPDRKRYYNDDDRMCAHYLYNWLQAYLDWRPRPATPPPDAPAPYRKHFPKAGMLVVRTPHYHAVTNLAKGGVTKVYNGRECVHSDTGAMARLTDGRVLVAHLVDEQHERAVEGDPVAAARVAGCLSERKKMLPTPLKQIVFRLLNLSLGRFAPNLLRKTLQKKLIVGKPRTAYRFERRIRFEEAAVTIEDRLRRPSGGAAVRSVHAGSDATSIYVANSNVYQASVLCPWRDFGSDFVERLNAGGEATARHRIEFE